MSDRNPHFLTPEPVSEPPGPARSTLGIPLIIFLICCALGITAAGLWFYHNQKIHLEQSAEDNLAAVADLKVNQIAAWRQERLGDANVISPNPIIRYRIKPFLEKASRQDRGEDIRSWMDSFRTGYKYQNVILFDRRGKVRLSVGPAEPDIDTQDRIEITAAVHSGKPFLSDFHRSQKTGHVELDLYVPLLWRSKVSAAPTNVGLMLLEINPEEFLYPLIQSWPTPSPTAETLLVRREGEEVLYLNELRSQKDSALNLRSPLTNRDRPAVMAVLGKEGIIQGIDYRGVPVLAALRKIPESPWFIVSKQDQEEVVAPFRFRALAILSLTGVVILALGLAALFWWKRREAGLFRRQYKLEAERAQAEAARRAEEERYRRTLNNMLEGCEIIGFDWRYLYVNDSAARQVRQAPEDLLGFTMMEKYPGFENTEMFTVFKRCLEEHSSNFTEVKSVFPDGSVGWLELSIQPVPEGIFIISLDITARKLAEEELKRYRDQLEELVRARTAEITKINRELELEIVERKKAEKELSLSNEILEIIFANTHLEIAYLDADFNFIRVNPAYARSSGKPPGYFLGRNHFDFYPHSENKKLFRQVVETGLPLTVSAQPFEFPDQPERGLTYWDWTLNPIKNTAGKVEAVILYLMEVTNFKRAEEQNRKLITRAAALSEIYRMVAEAGLDSDAVLGMVARLSCALIGDACVLTLISDDGKWLHPAAVHHRNLERIEFLRQVVASGLVRIGEGTAGRVAQTGQALLLPVVPPEEFRASLKPEYLPYQDRLGVFSLLIVPLRAQGKVIGTLGLSKDLPGHPFTEDDRALLQDLADRSALAIDNARLYKSAQQELVERKQAEEAVRRAVVYNRSLIEASLDPLVTIGPDGRITDVNRATETFTGRSREELIGTDFADYFTEPEQARAGYQQVFREGFVHDYPLDLKHRNGRVTSVLYNASVYRDESGRIIGVFAAARDISERKRAEEAVRRAVVYNRSLIEASLDPLVTIGSDGRITDVNRATETVTGCAREELIGTDFADYFTEPEQARAGYQRVFRDGSVHDYPLDLKHRNGRVTSVLYNASVYRDESGRVSGVFAAARDITERKAAQLRLEQVNRALRMLSDCNQALVRATSEEDLLREVCRILVETGGYKMAWVGFALSDQEKTIKPVATAGMEDGYLEKAKITWADSERGGGPTGACFRTGRTCVTQDIIANPEMAPWRADALARGYRSSAALPLLADGRAIAVLNIYASDPDAFHDEEILRLEEMAGDLAFGLEALRTRDKHYRVQTALSESEARYRTIIESMAEGVILYDAQGRIFTCNKSAEEILGLSLGEIAGRTSFDPIWRMIREDGSPFPAATRPGNVTLKTGQPCVNVIMGVYRSDGNLRWVSANSEPVFRTGESKPYLVVATFHDITEQRSLETQLRQVEKLEAVGRLAGGIAHDFNTILGTVMGYADMTLADIPEGSRPYRNLQEILEASQQGKQIVKQLNAVGRPAGEEMKTLALGPLIQESLDLIKVLLPAQVEVHCRLEARSDQVRVNPTQMNQVLMNLCTNASEAMGKTGGRLGINLSAVELDAEAGSHYPDFQPGPFLKLRISDTGPGMDPATLERIFDPYFTTKRSGAGTGLGLAIVQRIIREHRGFIEVKSRPGQGTVFEILLPKLPPGPAPDSPAAGPVIGGTERILLVDDEERFTRLTRQMLESLGYTVVAENDGLKALEFFLSQPESFDLVITDQIMPRIKGTELAREMKSVRPDLPVILYTGYGEKTISEDAREAGINELIFKPIVTRDLALAVRKILDRERQTP
ncbi:MAG: PAS domain S-box protein [bacterium]|nr:PAS domain S-box protein [bacterium]